MNLRKRSLGIDGRGDDDCAFSFQSPPYLLMRFGCLGSLVGYMVGWMGTSLFWLALLAVAMILAFLFLIIFDFYDVSRWLVLCMYL